MDKDQSSTDYDQPVAYDAEGNPLYARPPEHHHSATVVHMSRSLEPDKPVISESIKLKHQSSLEKYPSVNLSEGEYIISAVKRHPVGLFVPIALSIVLGIVSFIALFNYDFLIDKFKIGGNTVSASVVILSIIVFICLVTVSAYISYYVYFSNRFFLTNESVIQEIQNGLFSKTEQTVSLANIEDASFTQSGILPQIFNYGTIRLSTEGEETTYTFSYVAHPKRHIDKLNNAIEAFKNGRPVNSDED